MGIPANSQNKKAAFLFLQWLTSKDTDKKLALKAVTPSRLSTFSDPDVLEAQPAFVVVKEAVSHATGVRVFRKLQGFSHSFSVLRSIR